MRLLVEELIPYNANFFYNLVTVLDDSDLKRMGKWSEKTLSERYFENLDKLRAAEPKRDPSQKLLIKIGENSIFGETKNEHSNNWVISGEHTSTGKPMLASDPHLTATIPTFW